MPLPNPTEMPYFESYHPTNLVIKSSTTQYINNIDRETVHLRLLVESRYDTSLNKEALLDVVIYHKCYNEILWNPTTNQSYLYDYASGAQGFTITPLTVSGCEIDITFEDSNLMPLVFPTTFFTFDPATKFFGIPDTSIPQIIGFHEVRMTQKLRYGLDSSTQWI